MSNQTAWRNRIVEHGEMPASQFQANPQNWRIHPKSQRDALRGVLGEVGWVQNVIVNRATGHVIDGHARIEEALKLGDDTPVPFVAVDLGEDEEAKILLTLDPISAMAAADQIQLEALMRTVETQDAAVMAMIDVLSQKNSITPVDGNNIAEMWKGMPEFEQKDIDEFHSIIVHFMSEDDMDEFAKIIGQTITAKTKFAWYPKQEIQTSPTIAHES